MEENNKESLRNEFESSSNMSVKSLFKPGSQSDEKELPESFLRSANIYSAVTKGFRQLPILEDEEFFENPGTKGQVQMISI